MWTNESLDDEAILVKTVKKFSVGNNTEITNSNVVQTRIISTWRQKIK